MQPLCVYGQARMYVICCVCICVCVCTCVCPHTGYACGNGSYAMVCVCLCTHVCIAAVICLYWILVVMLSIF